MILKLEAYMERNVTCLLNISLTITTRVSTIHQSALPKTE